MTPSETKQQIMEQALRLGFNDCRFTTAEPPASSDVFLRWLAEGCHAGMRWMESERSIRGRLNPRKTLPDAKTVICLAASYYLTGPQNTSVARYARVADYHETLQTPLRQLCAFIENIEAPNSHVAAVFASDSSHLLERDLAQRAGLGFIGKHNNLISPKLGNWFFLSEIITTLELEPDPPLDIQCGSCDRCLRACPTGALRERHLDARRCLSYLTIEHRGDIPSEFHAAMGNRFFGCDRCLEACPWNRFARPSTMPPMELDDRLFSTELLESLDNAAFKQRFAGTAFLRAKRDGLLRNLRITEKNQKRTTDDIKRTTDQHG